MTSSALLAIILAVAGAHEEVEIARTMEDADALFQAARTAKKPAQSVELLKSAAALGHCQSYKMLGIAYAQGHGVNMDVSQAQNWFRRGADAGDEESAFNLVVLCSVKRSCVQGSATADQALRWFRIAGAQGLAEATFQAGAIELELGRTTAALSCYMEAAAQDHPAAMYNTAHTLASHIGSSGSGTVELKAIDQLAEALGWFGRALRASRTQGKTKVEADASTALWVQALWMQRVERDSSEEIIGRMFAAAAEADSAVATYQERASDEQEEESARIKTWQQAIRLWSEFADAFGLTPSAKNAAALSPLRKAMNLLESLVSIGKLGEFRRHLVLSKLVEGSKMLAQDKHGMQKALKWHHALLETQLCTGLFATDESQVACFNDQASYAVTLHRRLNDTAGADEMVARARLHPTAATQWLGQAQTPRVFHPRLAAHPWWDSTLFPVSAALEAAWASGAIGHDMARLGIRNAVMGPAGQDSSSHSNGDVSSSGVFERIVLTGAPIDSSDGVDLQGAGAWSEYMLFDGEAWNEDRCEKAAAICALLRAAPEVSGSVVGPDGRRIAQQGEVTIFRLLPGAKILPHVGVTNRRLVLQFPLRGIDGVRFRVADEWRSYSEGKTMIFDDSHEHEVVHDGSQDRYVLYAVLHHPGLGTPTLNCEQP